MDNFEAAFSGDIRNSSCWDSKVFATASYQVTGKTNLKTPKYRWIDTVNIIKCGHIVSSVLYFCSLHAAADVGWSCLLKNNASA
jgi:hypothetical protein